MDLVLIKLKGLQPKAIDNGYKITTLWQTYNRVNSDFVVRIFLTRVVFLLGFDQVILNGKTGNIGIIT